MAFDTDFPIIKSNIDQQGFGGNLKKVYISNININPVQNIDSTLYSDISDIASTIDITGDHVGFSGLIVIGDEIMSLSNGVDLGGFTRFNAIRARKFTKAFAFDSGEIIRSIQEVETTTCRYNDTTTSLSNSTFAPVIDDGEFIIHDNAKKWMTTSPVGVKEYSLAKNRPIYIFEGAGKQLKREYEGFIYDWDTSTLDNEITIMFKDKLILLNSKSISETKFYINQYTTDVLSDLLGDEIEFKNGTDKEHYGKLDRIITSDYSTYGDMLSYICEVKCIWIKYNKYGKIKVYSALFKEADTFMPTLEVKGVHDLININETTENQLDFNKFTCAFKERFPYYNRNQFLDGSTLRYVNFREVLLGQSITLMNSEGFINFDINFGTTDEINKIGIGEFMLIVDNSTNDEFYCKLFETSGTIGSFIGGFDRDRNWNPRGKNDYLISRGYTSNRNFDIHYSGFELQTIFALSQETEGDNKSSNLKIPILAQEEIEYNCKFGSFETNDLKFSGIVEEINSIYTETFDNSDLLYLRDYGQSDKDVPIYLLSNKLSLNGTGNEQLYYYSSFDNSNIEVNVDYSQDNDSNILVKIRNTLSSGAIYSNEPISVSGRILKVTDITLYKTGDVLKLHPDNADNPLTEQYYYLSSDVKWTIESKFSDVSGDYIILDKGYPIGDSNTQMKFNKYPYSEIIHLNEFRIKGNPVVERDRNIEKINQESLDIYDIQEYKFDGKLTTLDDLKYAVSFLYNNFAGLPDNFTRQIPFESFYRPDIETLDIVKLTDSNVVNFYQEQVIVTQKSVSWDMNNERTETYSSITRPENLATLATLDNVATLSSYKTLAPSVYNHNGNEGQTTELDQNIDDKYVSKESVLGNISILKIDTEDYWGIVQTTIRDDSKELTLQLNGDKFTYNTSIFRNGRKSVLVIGSEYMLVRSNTDIGTSTTIVDLIIEQRDLFETGQYEITNGQIAQVCQILQFTDKDGMVMDSTIYVGSIGGKIEFTESGIILDDYSDKISPNEGIYFKKTGERDLFTLTRNRNSGNSSLIFNNNNVSNLPKSLYVDIDGTNGSPVVIRTETTNLGSSVKDIIKIDGLAVGDSSYYNYKGAIKYIGDELYWYNGSSWIRLDNADIETYPGYADRIIFPTSGLDSASRSLSYGFNNVYFTPNGSNYYPCLTQFNRTVSTSLDFNPYVRTHLCDVSSGAITITIDFAASNSACAGKEYEFMHYDGNVSTNNITIDATGVGGFYALGGAFLSDTIGISSTGGSHRVIPINNKWYLV